MRARALDAALRRLAVALEDDDEHRAARARAPRRASASSSFSAAGPTEHGAQSARRPEARGARRVRSSRLAARVRFTPPCRASIASNGS